MMKNKYTIELFLYLSIVIIGIYGMFYLKAPVLTFEIPKAYDLVEDKGSDGIDDFISHE